MNKPIDTHSPTKLPKDKPQKQSRIPTDEELRCDNPATYRLKPDSNPIRFEVGVTFENEEAKKHPYKYDPRAKTAYIKANGEVIYTYLRNHNA